MLVRRLQEHCRFIVDVCSGAPVALSVVCNLLRYGHCDAAEFVRLYSDPRLPLDRSLSNTNTSFLPFESRATNERLQRCAGGASKPSADCGAASANEAAGTRTAQDAALDAQQANCKLHCASICNQFNRKRGIARRGTHRS